MRMQRLRESHLHLERPLPWNVYDEDGKLLLCKGYVISNRGQLESLLERGMFVDSEALKATNPPECNTHLNPFELWHAMEMHLTVCLARPNRDGQFETDVRNVSREVVHLVDLSPDFALATLIWMDQRKYPVVHSLHCAILVHLVGRRMGWPQETMESLRCAALTMNIALLGLQLVLCNQSAPLSPAQRQTIDGHPAKSRAMLEELGIKDPLWLDIVLDHHEYLDGKGYPNKIQTPRPEALLLRTTDIFAAKVSARAYRRPMTAHQAAKSLFLDEGKDPRNPFPQALIKEVGIYPPGCYVKLANGETALVVKRGTQAASPLVLSIVNPIGIPLVQPIARDTSTPGFEIQTALPRDNVIVQLRPEAVWKTTARA
ncbi:MAG: HD-GYP domain-containing protein [Limnobacter sp.]|jgi:HD-GYP domain-containing protein (c-di-GMP phosphodiesterase class II)|uniref:HD-GYP domain-containing protein n=1 Tax=Limnobacter sp. TaxID=2003368 RepID=UPI00391C26F0